eukprot:TRINITY_DN38857_c0_g1_i1.p1 TRINITY_DN38857_c0_g1~~TRINITY_DN38857_c0_g1_i1.p1  ORF type:complete len:653 (-),score=-19.68 TRINITY_DN38857_c0_g1_i1:435-2393(-)
MECLARAPTTITSFFFRSQPNPLPSPSSNSVTAASKLPLYVQGAALCPTSLTSADSSSKALAVPVSVPVGGAVVTVAVLEGLSIGLPTNFRPFDSLASLSGKRVKPPSPLDVADGALSSHSSLPSLPAPSTALNPSQHPRGASTTTAAFSGHHGSSGRAMTASTALAPTPLSGVSPGSTRVASTVLVSFLVNYSVLVSDWWQFKHTARDRLLACLGTRWPLAAAVAHTADPVKVAALATAATAAAAVVAAAVAAAKAEEERRPQLEFMPKPLRELGGKWFGGGSSQGKSGGEGGDGGEDGESDGEGKASESEAQSDGSDWNLFGLWNKRTGQTDGESDGEGRVTSVMRDDLDPSMVWGQRRKDVDAEQSRKDFLGRPGFSFSAAGLLFPYHLGVTQFLQESGYITEHTPLSGSSAGAIVCATIASGVDARTALRLTKYLAADCRENGTAFRLGMLLRAVLEEILPEDAHERCCGRIRVAVTQVFGTPRGVLVDQFDSRADLIDALITSSFVPGYLEPRPATRFRNRICVDGGLTHFMPPTASEETVRICAFPASALGLSGIGINPDVDPSNQWTMRQLFSWALEPPEDDILDELFEAGYRHAQAWASTYTGPVTTPGELQAESGTEGTGVGDAGDVLSLSVPLSSAASGAGN